MYNIIYSSNGKVSGIQRLSDGATIPVCEDNKDFREFIQWNSEQAVEIDLNSVNQDVINQRNTQRENELIQKQNKLKAEQDLKDLADGTAIDNAKDLEGVKEYLKKLVKVIGGVK